MSDIDMPDNPVFAGCLSVWVNNDGKRARCMWCGKLIMGGLRYYTGRRGSAHESAYFCDVDCAKAWDAYKRGQYPAGQGEAQKWPWMPDELICPLCGEVLEWLEEEREWFCWGCETGWLVKPLEFTKREEAPHV